MKKKFYAIILATAIACGAATGVVVHLNHEYEQQQVETTEEMQRFPSYDWDATDEYYLAAAAENIGSTDIIKQQAILTVLNAVWYEEKNMDIETYVCRHFELYREPTEHDYELVAMVVRGEWADED